jgi:hypothetical protein
VFPAAIASSPIKKSRSSVPRFPARLELWPAPPVKYDGLFATAGLPDPELAPPPPVDFVAMAVGKTHEGASFPANPMICQIRSLAGYLFMRTQFGEAGTAEAFMLATGRRPEQVWELTCP